ncbi:MAG: succinate dehydrogenase, hydrophobic membrane anchor protein [Thiobacillus sp.]|nr:succinate dehydrogenase, hydrophobic membrane anchor protein [Thiobacillus sp.]
MKSPTGSHTGTGNWLMQRATALLLALAIPVLLVYFLAALPLDFTGWQGLFAPLWSRVLLMLSAIALAMHAWVGMHDIFMDYIHSVAMRLVMTLAVVVVLASSVVWLAAVLFGARIGSGT